MALNGEIVVAIAQSRPTLAVDLFRRLSRSPHPNTSFAVLPREIDAQLLEIASEFLDDFVLWPTSREEIAQRIRRLVTFSGRASDSVGTRLLQEMGFADLVGEDPAFLRALGKIPIMADSDLPVLISGETGTGKEFSARAIHHLGRRRNYSFVPVDCGAIPDNVFENEMFGHARGGYTDAHGDQKGFAETANHGTLFLDEVDSLSVAAQSKMLRFLQERTFKPLGANKFVTVDVHIVAATNQDLEGAVRKGQFRADLYFRLNVLRLWLPPLRQRPMDIPLLAKHFLQSMEPTRNGRPRSFSTSALRKLALYQWPGNVRELYNIVQQAALTTEGSLILPEHILLPICIDESDTASSFRAGRERAIEAFERAYVEQLLRNSGGNVTRAAKQANRNRRSIGRLIQKYRIDRASLAE